MGERNCFWKIIFSNQKGYYYQEYLIHLIILHLIFLNHFRFLYTLVYFSSLIKFSYQL